MNKNCVVVLYCTILCLYVCRLAANELGMIVKVVISEEND